MPHKSLALLVCDTPLPSVVAIRGAYDKIFDTLLTASLPASSSTTYTLDPFDVVNKQEYPSAEALSSYDGIIITGSSASAYDTKPWITKLVEYTAQVIKTQPQIKVIGICFGHQIVARAVGGECVPNGGKWEVGITVLQLTDLGKVIFGVETLNIQQMHRDHVPSVPAPMQLLGSTSMSMNQGMVSFYPPAENAPVSTDLKNVHILTVQGHPEFVAPIVSLIVDARGAAGIMDAQTVQDARRRTDWRNDGVSVLGRTIWKVLGVE